MKKAIHKMKCPFCGWLFSVRWLKRGKVPGHTTDGRRVMAAIADVRFCQGSYQCPRNSESDRRPLWKDGGSP